MRTLDPAFTQHIASGATTLANCWRITRKDGVTFGLTDHDLPLSFDGTVFDPASGADGSEAAQKMGAQVDTSEIIGIVHADKIDESDILLGRFDGATVETWRVNWRDVTIRELLRRDTVGEIVREDGVFRLELRSPQHALNVPRGKLFQAICGTTLGSVQCGVDVEQVNLKTTAGVTKLSGRQSVVVPLLSGFEPGWFDHGKANWSSGARAGKTDIIVSQRTIAGETHIEFTEPVADWVEIGDGLTLYTGCDRRFSTCQAKFSNMVNFRGFPHIPGNDFVLRYPRAGSNFGGEPLVK